MQRKYSQEPAFAVAILASQRRPAMK